jgi:hypothetical protein
MNATLKAVYFSMLWCPRVLISASDRRLYFGHTLMKLNYGWIRFLHRYAMNRSNDG